MSASSLPAPGPLEIHSNNAAGKWTSFGLPWDNNAIATKLSKEDEAVHVGTLLTVVGEDARDMFSTFTWVADEDKKKISEVSRKCTEYC